MKKFTTFFTILVLSLSLGGCWSFPWGHKTPAGPSSPMTPQSLPAAVANTNTAISNVDNAQTQKDKETADLLGKVKANVVSAKASNQGNPDGMPKTKVDGELTVAENRLSTVVVDQSELAAARGRDLLVEQGKTAEARAAYEKAAADGKAQAAELQRMQDEVRAAKEARDAARTSEAAALHKYEMDSIANEAAFKKALDAAHNEVLRDQVKWLNIAGGGCLVLFALGLGFGGAAGLKLTWPFAVFSVLCFGLAQIIAMPWFLWAVGIATGIVVLASAWWVYTHYKLGTLQVDTQKKADQLSAVLGQVVPAIDSAYTTATTDEKVILDKLVFDPLSSAMDKSQKSVIHQTRAVSPAPDV